MPRPTVLRRFFIILLLFIVITISILYAYNRDQENQVRKCNVVLITTNVLRYNHLVPYGYERNTTPAMNAVAKEAFIFDNAFAQAGYTLPNMMSILTSLYPLSHGVLDEFKDKLPQRIRTLAQVLKIHGYKTAWFADLNEPHLFLKVGFGRGYDDKAQLFNTLEAAGGAAEWIKRNRREPFFITINSRHAHSPYLPLNRYKIRFTAGQRGTLPESTKAYLKMVYYDIMAQINRNDGTLHDIYDAKAKAAIKGLAQKGESGEISWMQVFDRIRLLTPKDKQYLLSQIRMHAYTARVQIDKPQNLRFIKAMYDSCILGIDQEVIKPVIDTLKKYKIYDKTMIIFTADHGESLGEHGLVGHGLAYWEQLIHVPLIVKLPGEHNPARIDSFVQSIDILPTILDYLDIEIPYHAQGNSFVPQMLKHADKSNYDYVYGANRNESYVRNRKWKLIGHLNLGNNVEKRLELFNMENDPGESINLVEKHPDIREKLLHQLNRHLQSLPKYNDGKHDFPAGMDEKTRERIKKTGYW
jgi:arylsulfatase A-like enzyme